MNDSRGNVVHVARPGADESITIVVRHDASLVLDFDLSEIADQRIVANNLIVFLHNGARITLIGYDQRLPNFDEIEEQIVENRTPADSRYAAVHDSATVDTSSRAQGAAQSNLEADDGAIDLRQTDDGGQSGDSENPREFVDNHGNFRNSDFNLPAMIGVPPPGDTAIDFGVTGGVVLLATADIRENDDGVLSANLVLQGDQSDGATDEPAQAPADQGDEPVSEGPGESPDDPASPLPIVAIFGTEKSDTLSGSAGGDLIDARGGDDTVFGMAGNDFIDAGAGNDRVDAGAGDDRINAGAGNDLVLAGDGHDFIRGGGGADMLFAGAGNDLVLIDRLDDGRADPFLDFARLDGGADFDTLVFTGDGAGVEIDLTLSPQGMITGFEHIDMRTGLVGLIDEPSHLVVHAGDVLDLTAAGSRIVTDSGEKISGALLISGDSLDSVDTAGTFVRDPSHTIKTIGGRDYDVYIAADPTQGATLLVDDEIVTVS